MAQNKFEMKIRQDDDYFVCEITNGTICLCFNNDGEEEDMQAIVDALNKPNVKWYSNNKLELDQHLEIMHLQYKYDELKTEKEKADKMLQYCSKLLENKKEEHAALKAKSKRLADIVEKAIDHFALLNSFLSELSPQKEKELSARPKWFTEAQKALAEWKEGTQQDPRDNPLIGDDDSWIHDIEMGDR